MLLGLVIAWILSLAAALRFAGYSTKAPFTWHPASLISSALVLGAPLKWALASAVGLTMLFAGAYWLPAPWSIGSSILFLGGAIPLPFCLVDAIRRDQTLRNVHYVFWNASSPLALQHEQRILRGGDGSTPQIAFYIGPEDWSQLPHLTEQDREYLNRFRVADGLYRASATNHFLQVFDSYGLHPFLIHSENEGALRAFQNALENQSGANPASSASSGRLALPDPSVFSHVEPIEQPSFTSQKFDQELWPNDSFPDIDEEDSEIENILNPTPSVVLPPEDTESLSPEDDPLDQPLPSPTVEPMDKISS